VTGATDSVKMPNANGNATGLLPSHSQALLLLPSSVEQWNCRHAYEGENLCKMPFNILNHTSLHLTNLKIVKKIFFFFFFCLNAFQVAELTIPQKVKSKSHPCSRRVRRSMAL